MARTTPAKVQGVLKAGGDYNERKPVDLTPYIETVNLVVTDLVAYGAAMDPAVTVDADRAEVIERWLAAWAHCMSNKTYKSRSQLGSSATFDGETGKGLEANNYGQMALRLDPTGFLVVWDTPAEQQSRTATGFWAGTDYDVREDW